MNKKPDARVAEGEYQDMQRESNFQTDESGNDILLIKSYALNPSIDQALWSMHDANRTTGGSKPISAKMHGVIDYVFAGTLCFAPLLLGLKNKLLFGLMGDAVALSAALTKDSQGVLPVMPLKTHRAIDAALLAGLAVTATTKTVRKHTPTFAFTVGMLALGITTVLLTDWNNKPKTRVNRNR